MTDRKRDSFRILSACAAAVFWLSACAGTGEAPATNGNPKSGGADRFIGDAQLGEELQQICPMRAITGFSENTTDTVVIGMGKDSFLIEMQRSCYALRDAIGIGLPSGATCLRPGDRLIVTEERMPGGPAGAMGTDRCSVNRIFRWTPAKPIVTPAKTGS